MDANRRFVTGTVALAVAALGHAAVTRTLGAAVVFVLVAVAIAFPAEVVVVRLGLLVHHVRPQVLGVPLAALAGWIALTYGGVAVAEWLLAPGTSSVRLALTAGVVAMLVDLILDPIGVRDGYWEYPIARISRPRLAGIPWWNTLGWLVLSAAVAFLASLVGAV